MQHTSLLIIATVLVLYNQCAAFKVDPYITCWENNRERPIGFRETLTYLNDSWCAEEGVEDLCSKYRNETFPYAGSGDVCDKPDPTTLITRNACKMEITFGANETATHTWSWKCIEVSTCILKDRNGIGRTGCKYTNKRINCCCNEYDYCNGDENTPIGQFYTKLAIFGRSDQFPINFTKLLSIDPGDVYVEIDTSVPGWETFQYGNITQEISTTTTMPPIGNITACNHGNNLVDIILLVDASCPMDLEQCEQQQQFIADTMASLRGIDTININNSMVSQVRIGYIKFLGRGESIVLIDLVSNDSLNIDITDPLLARNKIYNILKDSDICNNINQRSGNPSLLNGLSTAYDLFDAIDDGSIVNSTSDKILLVFSNCGVTNTKDICGLYTGSSRKDLRIIMVNTPVNDSMSEPETYIQCLVDDELNRIYVVDDSDNYTYVEIISQIQGHICANITTAPTIAEISSTILTTSEPTNHPSIKPSVISTTYITETSLSSTQTTIGSTESISTYTPITLPAVTVSPTTQMTHQPTVSPTIHCIDNWLIEFKLKLVNYDQTDINWKNKLQLSLLNAFIQTIQLNNNKQWEMNWCVNIYKVEIEFYSKIRRVLLQNDMDIVVTGAFTFNDVLKDDYFNDYNSTQFIMDYKGIFADEIGQNETDIQQLEFEDVSSASENLFDWTVFILWGALALLGICCVVVILGICCKKSRNDRYATASDNEHDQNVMEEVTDEEQQLLAVNI